MIEKWTDEQRAEYADILKGFRRDGVIRDDEHGDPLEYKTPDGWSFLEADIRVISAGVRRQGVCYAFPPGTKFGVGRP